MFQPSVGEELEIEGLVYRIDAHPSAPGLPYGQEGRQAVVYKLKRGDELQALKVFKPRYRNPYIVEVSRRMEKYADIPGMQACRRSVVVPEKNIPLLKENPELVYSALMPWIEGPTWMEVVFSRRRLKKSLSLKAASAFLGTMVELEQRGVSHGDISGANILLPVLSGGVGIELVDLEQMYTPGGEKPDVLPTGSPGYGFPRGARSFWAPYTDRFAGSVVVAEMLGFSDRTVITESWGDTYFSESELGEKCDRLTLMIQVISETWGSEIAALFKRNWFAETLEECSTFGEWLIHLPTTVKDDIDDDGEESFSPPAASFSPVVVAPVTGPDTLRKDAELQEARGEYVRALALYDSILKEFELDHATTVEIRDRVSILKRRLDQKERSEGAGMSPAATAAATVKPATEAKTLPFWKRQMMSRSKGTKILAIVIGLLLIAGLAVGISFAVKGGSSTSGGDLQVKYDQAVNLIGQNQYEAADALFEEISAVDSGFKDVEAQRENIKSTIQGPIQFSSSDLNASNDFNEYIPIKNLAGHETGSIHVANAGNYEETANRPDLIFVYSFTITMQESKGDAVTRLLVGASDREKYREEANKNGAQFVCAQLGQPYKIETGGWEYCFTPTEVTVDQKPELTGGYGADPVFQSLKLDISAKKTES